MRDTFFIFIFGVFIYLGFATLFSALLAQALVIDDAFRGKFGADFVDFLSPYIGIFGLWVFWFVITLVAVVIIFEKDVLELIAHISKPIKAPTFATGSKENNYETVELENVQPIEEPYYEEPQEKYYEEETSELQEVPTIAEVDSFEEIEEDIDKPAFLRKTNNKHNILDLAKEVKEQKNTLIVDELEENKKLLADIEVGKTEKPKNFKLPSLDFLQKPKKSSKAVDESELDGKIKYLIEKLAHFKIDGDVVRTYAGPVVSTFEFKPAANVKVSKILNLQDDLAMALSAETIRIQAPIPGKDVVGIEIPNDTVETIYLRELLDDKLFQNS
ncbi:MAG: DNA translocase FtsK, partial [Sulfurimonas sp.]